MHVRLEGEGGHFSSNLLTYPFFHPLSERSHVGRDGTAEQQPATLIPDLLRSSSRNTAALQRGLSGGAFELFLLAVAELLLSLRYTRAYLLFLKQYKMTNITREEAQK